MGCLLLCNATKSLLESVLTLGKCRWKCWSYLSLKFTIFSCAADIVSEAITKARTHYTNIYELIILIFCKYGLVVHGKIINQSEHNFTLSMTPLQSCHGMCKIMTDWVTVIKIRAKKYWWDLNYELKKCLWIGSQLQYVDQTLSGLSCFNRAWPKMWIVLSNHH